MAHFPSRQPGQLTNNKERGTIVPQDAEWRILAEETAQENDPRKLIEIVEALNHALNEQEQRKKGAAPEPRMREFRPHGKELNSAPSTAKRRQSSIDSLRRTMMSPLRRALWNVPPRLPGTPLNPSESLQQRFAPRDSRQARQEWDDWP